MSFDLDFVERLSPMHPSIFAEQLRSANRPSFDTVWRIRNEIKPVDLYCYLYARFGAPNGIQNFLRGDHSENLIHWEWTLHANGRIFLIQGHNFRTEIWVSGDLLRSEDANAFIAGVKATLPKYGRAIGDVRRSLEHWVEFINPYHRIRESVHQLARELEELDLPHQAERVGDMDQSERPEEWSNEFGRQGKVISRATGLCFGIRSMLPVLAEAFVNLLMYMLMKPNLKKDDRLRENLIRQPIDVRVKSLAHNCIGFRKEVDYSSEPCKQYHSLVNERNDLLHGNVVINKLKFNELYFKGNVPIFQSYTSMWDRAYGVSQDAVGLKQLDQERAVVDSFINYVLTCLDSEVRKNVELVCEKRDLGLCLNDGHFGVLFSGTLVDMLPQAQVKSE